MITNNLHYLVLLIYEVSMTLRKCPVCNVPVKLENLEKHIKRQHPQEDIDMRDILTKDEIRKTQKTKAMTKPKARGKMAWPVGIITIIIAIIVILTIINTSPGAGPSVGQQAPDFTVTSSTNTIIRLSYYRGMPILLIFMDLDCYHCGLEAGETLSQLYQTYYSNVQFITIDVNFISPDDTNERINQFKLDKNTPWEYALDTTHSITNDYGVDSTPQIFVIDVEGIVFKRFEGRQPIDYYINALDYVLS